MSEGRVDGTRVAEPSVGARVGEPGVSGVRSAFARAGRAWQRLTGRGNASLNPGLVAALLVVFVALSVFTPYFFTTPNLLNIGKAVAIVGIAAAGQTIVIIGGGFDLSVGSTMAAAGMLAAFLLEAGTAIPIAFTAAIALGVLIGAVNGTLITRFRINPLIATLGTLAIVRGLAFVISGGQEIVINDAAWLSLGTGDLLGIPYIVIVLLGTFLVFGLAMPRTAFGRYTYAIGSNIRAARLAGVAVDRWRMLIYVTCGITAALSGLVLTARTGSARPSAAVGFELDVITAVILGGASLSGGRGTLSGTLVGLLLIGVVNNGLTLAQVPAYWQGVVKGAILLAAVLYDELRRSRREDT
jgi:ribose/xylose/arabinose/galactoside ABC-type transport system permease subunit